MTSSPHADDILRAEILRAEVLIEFASAQQSAEDAIPSHPTEAGLGAAGPDFAAVCWAMHRRARLRQRAAERRARRAPRRETVSRVCSCGAEFQTRLGGRGRPRKLCHACTDRHRVAVAG